MEKLILVDTHFIHFLSTGSEEREGLGVGSIPVAILPSCQAPCVKIRKLMHYNYINRNIVG